MFSKQEMGNPFVQLGFSSEVVLKVVEFLKLADLTRLMASIFPILDEKIEEHKATLDPDNPRDYTDCYLNNLMVLCSQHVPWKLVDTRYNSRILT